MKKNIFFVLIICCFHIPIMNTMYTPNHQETGVFAQERNDDRGLHQLLEHERFEEEDQLINQDSEQGLNELEEEGRLEQLHAFFEKLGRILFIFL